MALHTTPTNSDTPSQHVWLPPAAAYVHVDDVLGTTWDILSARTDYIDATWEHLPMTVDMLRLMEYPPALDDPDDFTPITTWTELASEEVDAGKYIIFDYILTESKKPLMTKEEEIDNLFAHFVMSWTAEVYEWFKERISMLPAWTQDERDFKEALQYYLDTHSWHELDTADDEADEDPDA
jgi:hypothetical protein